MTKKPNFTEIEFETRISSGSKDAWKEKVEEATGLSIEELSWMTMEQINVSPLYRSDDIKDAQHIDYMPGIPPFLRGAYPTMYVQKPWTVRQYADINTSEGSNVFDIKNLTDYDSVHQKVICDIGRTGINIDSVEDMNILFDKIPLDKISVSIPMDNTTLPVIAFYIVIAKEQGVDISLLSGTVQKETLKEYTDRNRYIYPTETSIKIISDIFEYTSDFMPKFNDINISGCHMQKSGATTDLEMAYTLADGLEYLKKGIKAGLSVDDFAPRLSFCQTHDMNYFMEVAKMRAARVLWAKLIKQFNPQNPKSMCLRTHSQTSDWSLTKQEPFNNVARICVEAMAATLGHTQSLHTNPLDEAIALPTNFSSRIALNTQLYLQHETKITKVIDPWAGSYYVEYLTQELLKKSWEHILEVESYGGMTKAIEAGIPKLKIEEAVTKKQAKTESPSQTVVGVNEYKLEKLKQNRDNNKVQKALKEITECAETGKGNLLTTCINAARLRATLEEISEAVEKIYKRCQTIPTEIHNKEHHEEETNKCF